MFPSVSVPVKKQEDLFPSHLYYRYPLIYDSDVLDKLNRFPDINVQKNKHINNSKQPKGGLSGTKTNTRDAQTSTTKNKPKMIQNLCEKKVVHNPPGKWCSSPIKRQTSSKVASHTRKKSSSENRDVIRSARPIQHIGSPRAAPPKGYPRETKSEPSLHAPHNTPTHSVCSEEVLKIFKFIAPLYFYRETRRCSSAQNECCGTSAHTPSPPCPLFPPPPPNSPGAD